MPRPTASLARLAAALAAGVLVAAGCSSDNSTPPQASATPSPWPGQLTTAAPPAPAPTFAKGTHLRIKRSSLSHYTSAQVRAAYASVAHLLATTGASPHVVDPSRDLTAADFTAATDGNLTDHATSSVTSVATAALNGNDSASATLRPLMFWYAAGDNAKEKELRLAADPYRTNVVTAAVAQEASAHGEHGIAFAVDTELTLRLVDTAGSNNKLFLIRDLSVVMVPAPHSTASGGTSEGGDAAGSGPRWLVDAWTGTWSVTKPVHQKLPRALAPSASTASTTP